MLQRFWQWYFWNAAPTPYATRWSRFRCWLWWHTHPRWLMDVRAALMWKHAEEQATADRVRRSRERLAKVLGEGE